MYTREKKKRTYNNIGPSNSDNCPKRFGGILDKYALPGGELKNSVFIPFQNILDK